MENRRSFIKQLGAAGTMAVAPFASSHSLTPEQGEITVKGRVFGKTGIAQVAVSDGFSVVVTDDQGLYTFRVHPDAAFIFITIPSGYAIPHEKGVARFYQPVQRQKPSFTADFKLNKLSVDDRQHQFIVWADPQMISKEDAAIFLSQSVPDTQKQIASMGPSELIHGIGCGDLVWDHFELFEDYKKGVEKTGIPFFQVVGNHDMDLDARSDSQSTKTFKELFGPTYYSFNRGQVHYIVLDDVFFIGVDKKYIGYLPENQLSWLEQDLAQVPKGSTVVVSLHIPTQSSQQELLKISDKEVALGSTLNNREHLYQLLAEYRVYLMSGHTHFNEVWEKDNMIEHIHGTVCGAWWTGDIAMDGTPNGYGVYQVDGDQVEWFYKATGESRDHQMTLYPPGSSREQPDSLIANVWNWDLQWKIEWSEDGQAKGMMKQFSGYDPQSVERFLGAELPEKHRWVEPSITKHLFAAIPSDQAKEVKVKATDRFGNVYEQAIQLKGV